MVGRFVYDDDYIEIYGAKMDEMFGYGWTAHVEELFSEGEPSCGCGLTGTNPHTFWLFTIDYSDGSDNPHAFRFNNRRDFSVQVEEHIRRITAEYYQENFMDVYLYDVPLARTTRVRAETENPTPEGAIRLSEMTPASVFDMFPVRLIIDITLNGETAHPPEVERAIIAQVEYMLASMYNFTNGSLIANVTLRYSNFIDMYYYPDTYNGVSRITWNFPSPKSN